MRKDFSRLQCLLKFCVRSIRKAHTIYAAEKSIREGLEVTTETLGNYMGNSSPLESVLHTVKARYNSAAQDKRNAAAKMRDFRKDFKGKNPDLFEALSKAKADAANALLTALRSEPGFKEAEQLKRDGAAAQKEAIALAKERALDMRAVREVLKMAEMDPVECEEYFDRVDQYAKALRLWQSYQ